MTKVDNRDFVVAWATSQTLDDVAKATRMTRPAIKYRATILQKAGVRLPELQRSPRGLDPVEVSVLNALISKHIKLGVAK